MRRRVFLSLLLLLGVLAATPSAAERAPSSDLLLPYFEVDLTGFNLTTSFQVTSSHDRPVPVELAVFTNWGIEMLTTRIELAPGETRAFNLRDWLMMGQLPDRSLPAAELAHVQAAFSGQPSPADGLYYGSEVAQDRAVGYVTLRSQGISRPDSLWGSYFVIDPLEDSAQADVLVNIDRGTECNDLCARHALFFLDGGSFDGGTEVLLWTGRRGTPSVSSLAPVDMPETSMVVHALDGLETETLHEHTLAVGMLPVSALGLGQLAGTLDVTAYGADGETPIESFMSIRYRAERRYSAGLQSWCLPLPPSDPPPSDPPPSDPPPSDPPPSDPPPSDPPPSDPPPSDPPPSDPPPSDPPPSDPPPSDPPPSDPPPSDPPPSDPPPVCEACAGKVTHLTLRYRGSSTVHLRVAARRGPETLDVFDGSVSPGGTFQLIGPAGGNPGFSGTLGTEIRFYVDGAHHTTVHTSCSVPIGPGLVSGDVEVLAGGSSGGGDLCPL